MIGVERGRNRLGGVFFRALLILSVGVIAKKNDTSCNIKGASNRRRANPTYTAGTSKMEIFPRCRAEFHMPCSINWVWWLVEEVKGLLEESDEIEEVLRNTSLGIYNEQFNFWPEIIDLHTGTFVASGAPSTVESRVGRTVDEVFSAESPTLQDGLWDYVRALEDSRYFEFVGLDNYHTAETSGELTATSRIAYYSIACVEIDSHRILDGSLGDKKRVLAVMAAYSDVPANDLKSSCDAQYSDLCSIEYAALTNGAVTSALLKTETENDVRLVLYDVATGSYNRKYALEFDELCLTEDCFHPVIVDDSGIVLSHGMLETDRASLSIGTNILDREYLDVSSLNNLRTPANEGGAFAFLHHSSLGPYARSDDHENATIAFITRVEVFDVKYYVVVPFVHRRAEAKLGPYCEACSAFENYPCGWKNARTLLGYQQAMLLASRIDNETSFDEAWSRIVYDEAYAISTRGWKDFYAFAYDFNGTCVAHGRIPEFVGRNVTTNLYPFIGGKGIDIWDLHLQWVSASKTDGAAAIRYPWIDDNQKIFDKVVYVIQIARNGHNYYVAVGLGEAQPAIPTFAEAQHGYLSSEYRSFDDDRLVQTVMGLASFYLATAQNKQQYFAAARNVSAISYPTRQDLLDQGYSEDDVSTWWDNSTNPYVIFVYSETIDQVIIYNIEATYIGLSLSELAITMGSEPLDFDNFVAGDWQDFLVLFRKKITSELEEHYVFYDTVEIADHIVDGLADGVGERLHMLVFVRDEEAPPSAASLDDASCLSIQASSAATGEVPGDQCACGLGFGAETTWPVTKNWTAHGVDATLDLSCYQKKAVVSQLIEFYSMECVLPLDCAAGQYYDVDQAKCIDCPAGSYRLDTDVYTCIPCPLGTASSRTGQIICTECGRQEYADEVGSRTCKSCPLNTERYVSQQIQPLGTSREDCLCQLGVCDESPCKLPYRVEEIVLSTGIELDYAVHENSTLPVANWPRLETGAYITGYRESTGETCEACPEGAICLGGTNPPFPAKGYSGLKWGEIVGIGADYEYKGVERHELQNQWHNRVKFSRCEGANKGQDRCKANFRCHRKRRRQDRLMCWALAKGRVELFGEEWQCPSSPLLQWLLTIFMFVAAIIVFLFLNVLLGSFTAMDIFLNNTRSMSIIKDFNLSWPLDEKWLFSLDKWFTFLDISQIDVEIVEPTCITNTTFLLQVVFQLCLLVLEVLFYFGGAFVAILRRKRQQTLAHDDRQSLISRAISRTLSATTMMYPTLADVGFRGFACREFADGNLYLLADLDIRCWDTNEHKRLLILCSLLTAMVFAYPVAIWLKLKELQRTNRLHNSMALERYGLIYEGFKLENYQWGVFQIFKALVLSMIQGVLSTRPTMQVFAALNFLIFSVACHFYYTPFLHRKSDALEAFFLFATCIMIGIGSTFNTLDSEDSDNAVEHVLYGLLHLLLFTCVGVSLRAVYIDIRERKLTAQSRARLRELVNKARKIEYESNGDAYGPDGDVKTLKEYVPTEIHDTLKPEPLHRFVRSIHSMSTPSSSASAVSVAAHFADVNGPLRRGKKKRSNTAEKNASSPEEIAISKSTREKRLQHLAHQQQLLRDIGEIDEWFSPALSDVGIASVFSNAEEGVFWRRLELALPDMFEFLSLANADTVVRLKVALGQLIAADVHVYHEKRDGARRVGYRNLIAKEDRGALLRGLILTDESHRQQFFRILDALAHEKFKTKSPISSDPRVRKGESSRVPLGYERGSGRHTTSSTRRALRMTSTQYDQIETALSLSSLPPDDIPNADTASGLELNYFESPKNQTDNLFSASSKSSLGHLSSNAQDLEHGELKEDGGTLDLHAIPINQQKKDNADSPDHPNQMPTERAYSQVREFGHEDDDDASTHANNGAPLSEHGWFIWSQAKSTEALPKIVAARPLTNDLAGR